MRNFCLTISLFSKSSSEFIYFNDYLGWDGWMITAIMRAIPCMGLILLITNHSTAAACVSSYTMYMYWKLAWYNHTFSFSFWIRIMTLKLDILLTLSPTVPYEFILWIMQTKPYWKLLDVHLVSIMKHKSHYYIWNPTLKASIFSLVEFWLSLDVVTKSDSWLLTYGNQIAKPVMFYKNVSVCVHIFLLCWSDWIIMKH